VTRAQVIERLNALKGRTPGRRHGFAPHGLSTHALRGDHSLNTEDMRHPGPLTTAAVLVPLVDRPEELTVLLTQRAAHLNDHAGQISFPGGRIEASDRDPEHAALREANEEIGLMAEQVAPILRLDDYETRTGFLIYPVVALVTPPLELKLDPFEVADVFEVPLAFILDPANVRIESRMYKGYERHFYAMTYEGRYIWGATAGMLVNLGAVLVDRAEA
jgi:8-oxo-dGTP pyrophosphatase MutT (NUDIX family)